MWFFSKFFNRKSPLFSLKIKILKIKKHGHVAEDVCFHMKPPYCWYNACPRSYKHKQVKIFNFSAIFGRKSPIFSLKIEILKIRKHRHVAEDVCFHIKPSHSNSHAHPKRSVGAIWGHPSILTIQNGRWSAILNLITRQITGILTMAYSPPLISISGQSTQFWRSYKWNVPKLAKIAIFDLFFQRQAAILNFFEIPKWPASDHYATWWCPKDSILSRNSTSNSCV